MRAKPQEGHLCASVTWPIQNICDFFNVNGYDSDNYVIFQDMWRAIHLRKY